MKSSTDTRLNGCKLATDRFKLEIIEEKMFNYWRGRGVGTGK